MTAARMRGALVVIVLLLTGIAIRLIERPPHEDGLPVPASTPTEASDPLRDLAALRFTPEELDALLHAGLAIQKGALPSQILDAKQLATFPVIEQTLTTAVCPPIASAETCTRYRIDVRHCLDRAAEIVAWRHRARDQVDWKLVTAAMGVSVTGREFPSFPNLVRFCGEMRTLDPATRASPAAQR